MPTAIVTGAGRGVGRSIALALARAGWSVALLARSDNEVAAVAGEITAARGHALALTGDVSARGDVERAVTAARGLGPIGLLVNNAGSGQAIGPLWQADPEVWWRDVEINLRGTFLCCHAVVPEMIAAKSGRIINLSSYAAVKTSPYHLAYATSKAGIIRLTEGLAQSLQGMGVFAFVISPGNVQTAMTDAMMASPDSPSWFPKIAARRADEWQSPEAAANLAVKIASGAADGLSGRFVHVNDDIEDFARRVAEIRQRDLLTLRLNGHE